VHLDYDAMVVKEAERSRGEVSAQEVRDYVSMVYGRERSALFYGDVLRVTVDWPFCISKRAEEYMSIGRNAGRFIECNFFTAQATEAWKRSLTRHVAGEYNAFTVFLNKNTDIAEALRPSFENFLEAHRDSRLQSKEYSRRPMRRISGIITRGRNPGADCDVQERREH